MVDDFESRYRSVLSRDARFDGRFFTAVTSTRVYCRPSCPARTPKAENVRFYRTAAAAQAAGFRACLRCRPDAAPGSPEWLERADVAARAMNLILDGVVDRDGVSGLSRSLGYSERQLHRVLTAELGTGALSLARAQRAQTARVLLQTTDIAITEVAFAAGFSSLRQFNDTIRAIFARTPGELRRRRARQRWADAPSTPQAISVRLSYRRPLAASRLFKFLGLRAIPGVEAYDGGGYRRSLRLPNGHGTVALRAVPDLDEVRAEFALEDIRDLTAAISRCRHLLNLDADPVAVDDVLGADSLLAESVAASPGLRVPGATDGFELAVRAIIGQQVSVAGARTVAAKIVKSCGERLATPILPITHRFPTPTALAEAARREPQAFAMPASRRHTLARLAEAVAEGKLAIGPGADRDELTSGLEAMPGIGPWTAGYIGMRAVGDPDAFIAGDLGVQRALAQLGAPHDARGAAKIAERWRPWRAYAVAHLWTVPLAASTASGPAVAKAAGIGAA